MAPNLSEHFIEEFLDFEANLKNFAEKWLAIRSFTGSVKQSMMKVGQENWVCPNLASIVQQKAIILDFIAKYCWSTVNEDHLLANHLFRHETVDGAIPTNFPK